MITLFIDCIILIGLNIDDFAFKHIDFPTLTGELLIAALSMYSITKLFKWNKRPLDLTRLFIRIIAIIILITLSFVMISIGASSHVMPLAFTLEYISIFILIFLGVSYSFKPKSD